MNPEGSSVRSALSAWALASWIAASVAGAVFAVADAGGLGAPAPMPTESPPTQDQRDGPLLLPDLVTEPPSNVRLVHDSATGRLIMRFSNTIANIGEGPVDLRGRATDEPERYQVSQLIRHLDYQYHVEPVDDHIIYHPDHHHWHLEGFARYELWSATAAGQLRKVVSLQGKVSYCLLDGDPMPEGAAPASYTTCNPRRQGISVGWSDTYTWDVAGQWVDLSGLEDGHYVLRSVVNPRGVLHEARLDNNDALFAFELSGRQVRGASLADDPWTLVPASVRARWDSFPPVTIRPPRQEVLSPDHLGSRP